MASITVTATAICSGGDHLTLTITGAKSAVVMGDLNEMQAAVSDDELNAFVKVLCKLCKSNKTVAAFKTAVIAGLTVTV